MHVFFIANGDSIHTERWIAPLLGTGLSVTLCSAGPIGSKLEGVRKIELKRLHRSHKLQYFHSTLALRRILSAEKPDILHAHYISGNGWLGYLSGHRPFVITAWGSDLLRLDDKSAPHRLVSRLALRSCQALTVPSELMLDKATSIGVPDAKVKLIRWGVETDIFRPEPDDRNKTRDELGIGRNALVILSSRAIRSLYNIDVILKAFAKLVNEIPAMKLVLMRFNEDPAYFQELQELISLHGLDHRTHWLARQASQQGMARVYRMSDVVVSIPSSEGYGFTVFEAMASGCATIISDLPVFSEFPADGSQTLKVPVCDVDSLSAALRKLLSDVDLRASLQRAGPVSLVSQSVDSRVAETMELYESLA